MGEGERIIWQSRLKKRYEEGGKRKRQRILKGHCKKGGNVFKSEEMKLFGYYFELLLILNKEKIHSKRPWCGLPQGLGPEPLRIEIIAWHRTRNNKEISITVIVELERSSTLLI